MINEEMINEEREMINEEREMIGDERKQRARWRQLFCKFKICFDRQSTQSAVLYKKPRTDVQIAIKSKITIIDHTTGI